MRKKEEETKETEATLLQELCGADAQLYACLSTHLYETPLAAISQEDLDIVTEEAEKSGNFRPAMDKTIFEGARNPAERERYIKAIQNLASKTIHAAEQEKDTAEKEGLTELAASLRRRIENQRLMSERTDDVLNVASRFYNEKLVELGEQARRDARGRDRKEAEREDKRISELEKAGREARRQARRGMGREEKREAKKQDGKEERAAEQRKEARGEERHEAEREERRIGELEQAGREVRKEGKGGSRS
jgi:hypothetical protein